MPCRVLSTACRAPEKQRKTSPASFACSCWQRAAGSWPHICGARLTWCGTVAYGVTVCTARVQHIGRLRPMRHGSLHQTRHFHLRKHREATQQDGNIAGL
jgi:hypothetical protein